MRIGVVGYSSGKFDVDLAKVLVDMALSYLVAEHPDSSIVSGLTNLGIPKLAYEWASERGLKTVGIACAKAKDYECFAVDEQVIVGKDWGDESQTFLDSVDCLVRIGGGKQSMEEVNEFKTNHPKSLVIELELKREDD